MLPLKRSASFKISVDNVKIEPVIKYQNGLNNFQETDETEKITQNGDFHIQNGGHQIQNDDHQIQNGDHQIQNGDYQIQNGDHQIQNDANLTEEINDDAPLNILAGADWESLNYSVLNIEAGEEVTGLAISEEYIAAQFFLEPEIHVFSRKDLNLLHRLSGHDYGGQAVQILDNILYSGSKDCSVRSWNLGTGKEIEAVNDHRDYVQCLCVKKLRMDGLGEDGEITALVSGGAADHRIVLYSTDNTGRLKKRHQLDGHSGWITCLEMTDTMVISGSKDCTVKLWDLASGDILQSLTQDSDITCISTFSLTQGYLMYGDGEGKMSLLDLSSGESIHLMPNTLVGTGRYRRSSRYHDKTVDHFTLCDNGYMVTASLGSKFIKIWKIEKYEDCILKTDVTELQILREHSDYLSVVRVLGNTIISCSGDGKIFLHTFPEGEQHYDMLRTQERNSVAVLFEGENGLAPSVDRPTIVCQGRLCKAGKTGLARSSSSFQVSFSLRQTTASAEGRLQLPQTIEEDSEEEDEFIIEYVTDSEEELEDGDQEW